MSNEGNNSLKFPSISILRKFRGGRCNNLPPASSFKWMDNLNGHIAEIYSKYSKALYCTAYRILNNPLEAEDAMQETIIKYYKSFHLIKIRKTESYLKSICIRKSIDILRRKKLGDAFCSETLALSKDESLDEASILGENTTEMIEKIKESILLLPAGYRVVLSLYLFEGYDYAEISQILSVKESSVRSQYMRGKEKLLKMLKATEYETK